MPKTKKLDDSSSDSDSSGPRDRNPPPSKKAKSDSSSSPAKPSGAGGSKSKKNEDECWPLDKTKMVKINEFRGRIFIDIREYYDANGELKPGKKGISLTAIQFQKLKEIIPEVEEALKNH